jgi:soluble lytic murein transglycosylase
MGAIWLVLTFLLSVPVSTAAQDLPPPLHQALTALESGDCPATLDALEQLAEPFPEPLRHQKDLLRGYCFLKIDRPAEALTPLERAADEYELLADYALNYAARAARALGDLEKAIAFLSRLLARYPSSHLAEDAHFRLAASYLEGGDRQNAETALLAFVSRYPASPKIPEAFWKLAELLVALDRPQEAIPLLKRLYLRLPATPEASEAERLLQKIIDLKSFTPDEYFLRAKFLLEGGRYREAAAALTPFLQPGPQEAEARLLLGRSLFALKEYPQVIPVLLPLIDADPSGRNSSRAEALHLSGRALLRSGEYPQAIAHLERLVEAFPQHPLADDALYLIGLNQEERQEGDAALEAYARLLRHYRDGGWGDVARWRRAWLLHHQKKPRKALHELDHLLEEHPKSPLRAQALYWRGRWLEQEGKGRQAAQVYRRLLQEFPLDPYYSRRARERLRLPAPSAPSAPSALPVPSVPPAPSAPALQEDLTLTKARELAFLRLSEEAASEYWELARIRPDQIPLQREACQVLSRANQFDKAIWIARRTVRTLITKGQKEEVLAPFWPYLYPRAFWEWVDRSAAETGLDPYLVIALIREESAFSPKALSWAGARGLMQLMPATAARVAREANLPFPNDLDAPGPNITLGTRYLAQLLHEFQGNLILALAAYNAGPHHVRRWVNERPLHDLDEFVEDLSYPETREYVKRVLGSYERYVILYGGKRGD